MTDVPLPRGEPWVPENTRSLPALSAPQGLLTWIATVDHKQIGILYIVTSLFFLVVGGIEALFMRLQLALPRNQFMDPEVYNQLFTMHGTSMVFLAIMPLLIGFGNYFVPLMIGARDMAFPRLNMLSYWCLFLGGITMLGSFFVPGGAAQSGWTSYAPLSVIAGTGQTWWLIGMIFLITSSQL